MKKYIQAVLTVAIMVPGACLSQSRVNGGAGHFKMGYANYSMSAMNDWLPASYPQLRSGFTGAGGGGYGLINNLVIGGEGMGFQGTSVSKDTLSVMPSLGMGMFNLGYVVYQRYRTLFYPVAGIGERSFSAYFNHEEYKVTLHRSHHRHRSQRKPSYFVLVMRAGRLVPPGVLCG